MANLSSFLDELSSASTEDDLLDFCRRRVLHGTPFVFREREDAYYDFRKRIASHFEITYRDIFITGSAKLGFSPFKRRSFDYDSDIDVAIVSSVLFDYIMRSVRHYQMRLRESRSTVHRQELTTYHRFLEYTAIGWIRPDLLPPSFTLGGLKSEWFDFFQSISYGNSEVGNYKVAAGAFQNYSRLEEYTKSGLSSLRNRISRGDSNSDNSDQT